MRKTCLGRLRGYPDAIKIVVCWYEEALCRAGDDASVSRGPYSPVCVPLLSLKRSTGKKRPKVVLGVTLKWLRGYPDAIKMMVCWCEEAT